MKSALIFLLLILFSIAHAQSYKKYGIENNDEELPVGLQVGEKAPDFELKSDENVTVSLRKELEEGPVVIVFYRGKWCGVCNRYLSSIQDSISLIKSAGGRMLAITLETTDNAQVMRENVSAEFPILIDSDEETMKNYGVLFDVTNYYVNKVKIGKRTSISSNNGNEESTLPVPATYVIDQKGRIVFRHFDYDYKKRASVEMILEALRDIQ